MSSRGTWHNVPAACVTPRSKGTYYPQTFSWPPHRPRKPITNCFSSQTTAKPRDERGCRQRVTFLCPCQDRPGRASRRRDCSTLAGVCYVSLISCFCTIVKGFRHRLGTSNPPWALADFGGCYLRGETNRSQSASIQSRLVLPTVHRLDRTAVPAFDKIGAASVRSNPACPAPAEHGVGVAHSSNIEV